MQKYTKIAAVILSAFMVTGAFTACTSNNSENSTVAKSTIEEIGASDSQKKETVKQAFEKGEKTVKDWIATGEEYGKEEVQKATSYLKEHMSELEKDVKDVDEAVSEKLVMAATFLEETAKKDEQAAEHNIAKFASGIKSAAQKVWSEGKEWGSEELQTLKKGYEAVKEEIEKAESSLVDEFHKLINKDAK